MRKHTAAMKKHTAMTAAIGLIAAVGIVCATGMGDIRGSKHDFSASGWSDGEICKPCHTPHFANSQAAPLWNHKQTSATYALYDSDSMDAEPGQPGLASTLCLSCHDGTVALDSFGGTTGVNMIDGSGLIGTDLSNDHPVGIDWLHQDDPSNCLDCHNFWGDELRPLPFFDGKVECMSCHEPHNSKNIDGMLRLSLIRSQLCMICHSI